MITPPILIDAQDIPLAWLTAIHNLKNSNWKLRNLVVHIKNYDIINHEQHVEIQNFLNRHTSPNVKQVAYTIFPYKMYGILKQADKLYEKYNAVNGFFDKHYRGGWGTYFRRMTNYKNNHHNGSTPVNQLKNIISAINTRNTRYRAAYSIVIQLPGTETTRQRGGPCLNYIAIQIEPCDNSYQIGLLCIYRNHDFFNRAYGNYIGLYNLANFIANETGLALGPITCISSNAYVANDKEALRRFLQQNYRHE